MLEQLYNADGVGEREDGQPEGTTAGKVDLPLRRGDVRIVDRSKLGVRRQDEGGWRNSHPHSVELSDASVAGADANNAACPATEGMMGMRWFVCGWWKALRADLGPERASVQCRRVLFAFHDGEQRRHILHLRSRKHQQSESFRKQWVAQAAGGLLAGRTSTRLGQHSTGRARF